MSEQRKEACGRCSMSTVVEVVGNGDDENADEDRSPFGGARIEVPEDELRAAARPVVWAGAVKRRLDEVATRLTYGR